MTQHESLDGGSSGVKVMLVVNISAFHLIWNCPFGWNKRLYTSTKFEIPIDQLKALFYSVYAMLTLHVSILFIR